MTETLETKSEFSILSASAFAETIKDLRNRNSSYAIIFQKGEEPDISVNDGEGSPLFYDEQLDEVKNRFETLTKALSDLVDNGWIINHLNIVSKDAFSGVELSMANPKGSFQNHRYLRGLSAVDIIPKDLLHDVAHFHQRFTRT